MNAYDFELSFALPPMEGDIDDLVDLLYESGCDDATLGLGLKGHVAMMFTRTAASAREAVLSAIGDVRSAIPDARLEEADPDLVGLSDVAALLGVSRQNVRKLLMDSPTSPPAPTHLGSPALWRLADLLRWLREVKRYRVDDKLIEVAETTRQVNLAIAGMAADRRAQREILALLR
jgi:hypothetical protein